MIYIYKCDKCGRTLNTDFKQKRKCCKKIMSLHESWGDKAVILGGKDDKNTSAD